MMTFEVRNLGSNGEPGTIGNSFYGTEGHHVRGQGFFDAKGQKIPVEDLVEEPVEGMREHSTWLNALRTRKQEDIAANMEVGHISCAHAHLGNIAYRLGQSLEFNPKTERFTKNADANKMLTRNYREGFEVKEL